MGKRVDSILRNTCERLGYTKKGYLYIKPISPGISSTICFNIVSRQNIGHCLIGPRIGLIFEDVEKLLRDVTQAEWLKCRTNTISEHIGYLMPQNHWTEWDFVEHESTPECVIEDFSNALSLYSNAFFNEYPSKEKLISYIEGLSWGSAYFDLFLRLPILFYCVGRKQDGLDYMTNALSKHDDSRTLFTDMYFSNYSKLP